MSSIPPQQFTDDGSRPHLVVPTNHRYLDWLAYLPDGRVVVGFGSITTIWNLETGQQEGKSMDIGEGIITKMALTWDGTKIICSSKQIIEAWDVESQDLIRKWPHVDIDIDPFLPSFEQCCAIAISPDNRLIAVGYKNVKIYTMEGIEVETIDIGTAMRCRCLYFSPESDKLACGFLQGGIRLYGVDTGQLVGGPFGDGKIHCMVWSRDGRKLFSTSTMIICCWNPETGELLWTARNPTWFDTLTLSPSPDGSILASTSNYATVRFHDTNTGNPVGQSLNIPHTLVLALRFSPCGEFLASGGSDGKICVWRAPRLNYTETQTSHTVLGLPVTNIMQYDQAPVLCPPPPYSMRVPDCEPMVDLEPDTLIDSSSSLPDVPPTFPALTQNQDEHVSFEASTISNAVDVGFILPNTSLQPEERQRVFELRLRELFCRAASTGLLVPRDLILSNIPERTGQNTESVPDVNCISTHASLIESSTSVFRSASGGDPKKARKIDRIKEKLAEMLREIGFGLPNDRLPWSTLEGKLTKAGYKMVNWPEGVVREKDKGAYSLSAEEADKLYRALFLVEDARRLRFVRHGEESVDDNGVAIALATASQLDKTQDVDHSRMRTTEKLAKFKVTTAEGYIQRPPKRQRVNEAGIDRVTL